MNAAPPMPAFSLTSDQTSRAVYSASRESAPPI